MCEEIVIWTSTEFGFLDLPDALCTGSSIMPQKKNPDMAELVRAKTGRVYGHLISLLTVMKGLPLSYNRDLQEDKEPVFDAIDTVAGSLRAVELMVSGMKLNEENLSRGLKEGFLTATDLADYLAAKKIPFRKAHEMTGQIVQYCIERGKRLDELTLSVRNKDVQGGTAPGRVTRRLKKALRKSD
jgi:argininosuccinate lyase